MSRESSLEIDARYRNAENIAIDASKVELVAANTKTSFLSDMTKLQNCSTEINISDI